MSIEVKNLKKIYHTKEGEDVHALENVTFSVKEGEFVSVVGPSGCGKSTLLKILAGILPKTAGETLLMGTPITGPRTDIGIVFQSPVLLPWRTIIKNVLVPVEIQGLEESEYRERALEILDLVGLEGFEKKFPYELSGGMQQRVGLGRAWICDPTLLLMDEPFGALDAMTRERMNMELLRIWSERKKTVLFITHSIPESVLLSDRVIVLTKRPGTVLRVLEVDLPRPRKIGMSGDFVFNESVAEIRELMASQEAIKK